MPQMAPTNWMILFLYFNMIMIIIISINHYFLMLMSPPYKTEITQIKYNWKW